MVDMMDQYRRWRWRISAILMSLVRGVLAANDNGDEFSNNLFSDLSPLLALFGEQFAKQFMSHSLTIADNIIFAMAPLGILTAIVGAIRTGGPAWLRSIVGRARENHAAAEVEYMSSVSHEVCEVWNGSSVVRIPGSPEIQMFVYIKENDGTFKTDPKMRSNKPTFGIFTLEETSEPEVMKFDRYGHDFIWNKMLFKQSANGGPEIGKMSPYKVIDRPDKLASNITLNLARSRVEFLYVGAVVGILLQGGVLVLSGMATYKFGWKIERLVLFNKAQPPM